jgi:hypothetical protein
MSLYIDPKNQTLLWNTINKNPLVTNIFYDTSQKSEWFKTIISQIYSKLPSTISKEILLEKNKETILIMISDLKKRNNQSIDSVYSRNQSNNTSISNELQQRQKEYESMIKKPVIEEISFKEQSEDTVIKNMDELIQQQLKERELDLQRISKTYVNTPQILNIKEIIPKDELNIENIQLSEKKNVTWGTNSIIDDHYILEKKMDELNQKYENLLKYLEGKIPNFTLDFLEKKELHQILLEQIERIENE